MTKESDLFEGIEQAIRQDFGVTVWVNGFGICSTSIARDIWSSDVENDVGRMASARGYTVDDALRNVSQNFLVGEEKRVDAHLYTVEGILAQGGKSVVAGTLEACNPITTDPLDVSVRMQGNVFYAESEGQGRVIGGVRNFRDVPFMVTRADSFVSVYETLRRVEFSDRLLRLLTRDSINKI